jgi:hypothetical protein
VEKMVPQRLEEENDLAQVQQVIGIVQRVLLSLIVRTYKQNPHAVRRARSRFIEGFMFETRATVDRAYERSTEMVVLQATCLVVSGH